VAVPPGDPPPISPTRLSLVRLDGRLGAPLVQDAAPILPATACVWLPENARKRRAEGSKKFTSWVKRSRFRHPAEILKQADGLIRQGQLRSVRYDRDDSPGDATICVGRIFCLFHDVLRRIDFTHDLNRGRRDGEFPCPSRHSTFKPIWTKRRFGSTNGFGTTGAGSFTSWAGSWGGA